MDFFLCRHGEGLFVSHSKSHLCELHFGQTRWLRAHRVVRLIVEQDVLVVCWLQLPDLRQRAHVHNHSSISVQAENLSALFNHRHPQRNARGMAHRPHCKKVLLSVLLQLLTHFKELSAKEPCCTHADVHRTHLLDHDFERLLPVKFEGISRHTL